MSIFTEKGGKASSTRAQATFITVALVILAFWAATDGKWDVVTNFGNTLALLAAALYGINKAPDAISAAKSVTEAQPQ